MCKLILRIGYFFSILFSLKNINIKAHNTKLHNQTNAFMSAERGFCKKYAVSSKMCTPPILEIKCKDNCSLWVLDEIIKKKIFWKFEKKIVGAIWELPIQPNLNGNRLDWLCYLAGNSQMAPTIEFLAIVRQFESKKMAIFTFLFFFGVYQKISLVSFF